ncbi:conserved hypothetical protein [Sphingorhabdus sp. 109]|nr:conserved hypothetical protein [Sphingorhabdus sp. 109]
MLHRVPLLGFTGICLALAGCDHSQNMALDSGPIITTCESLLTQATTVEALELSSADGRPIPFEIIRPDKPGLYPLVVFSHGAFAAPDRYHALLRPLAAAGYVIFAPMHLDSEEWQHEKAPSRDDVWSTRGTDLVLGLSVPSELKMLLARSAIRIDAGKKIAMGHSYGALLAQIASGAIPAIPSPLVRDPSVSAVVAFSPPGPTARLIDADGWAAMSVPSLTVTGTSDIIPGFIDDWEVHKASYIGAPAGKRWLWVGEGVDHYFGGMIGREKPADARSAQLLNRATSTTVAFLQSALKAGSICSQAGELDGESLNKD